MSTCPVCAATHTSKWKCVRLIPIQSTPFTKSLSSRAAHQWAPDHRTLDLIETFLDPLKGSAWHNLSCLHLGHTILSLPKPLDDLSFIQHRLTTIAPGSSQAKTTRWVPPCSYMSCCSRLGVSSAGRSATAASYS